MALDSIQIQHIEILAQLLVQVEFLALLLMDGNDMEDQRLTMTLALLFEVMERKSDQKGEMMITLIVMMVEVQHEHRKLDGHELEETQETQTLELRIEEMGLDLIQMQPIVMWGQLLALVETHLVT